MLLYLLELLERLSSLVCHSLLLLDQLKLQDSTELLKLLFRWNNISSECLVVSRTFLIDLCCVIDVVTF